MSENTTTYTNSGPFLCYHAAGNIISISPNVKHPTSVNSELDTARIAIGFKNTKAGYSMAEHNNVRSILDKTFSHTEKSIYPGSAKFAN